MTCLRAARAQGLLKPADEQLCGTIVPLPLLKQALVHKHDQVSYISISCLCLYAIFLISSKVIFETKKGKETVCALGACGRPGIGVREPSQHWDPLHTGNGPDPPLPAQQLEQSVTWSQTADGQPIQEGLKHTLMCFLLHPQWLVEWCDNTSSLLKVFFCAYCVVRASSCVGWRRVPSHCRRSWHRRKMSSRERETNTSSAHIRYRLITC